MCHEEGNGSDLLTGGGGGGGAPGGIEEGLVGQFPLAIAGKVAGCGCGGLDVEEVGELVGGGRGFGLLGEVVVEGLAGFGELIGGELEEGGEEGDFAFLGELAGGCLKLGGGCGDLPDLQEGESAGVVEDGVFGVELVGFFVVGEGAVEVVDLAEESGAECEGGGLGGLEA